MFIIVFISTMNLNSTFSSSTRFQSSLSYSLYTAKFQAAFSYAPVKYFNLLSNDIFSSITHPFLLSEQLFLCTSLLIFDLFSYNSNVKRNLLFFFLLFFFILYLNYIKIQNLYLNYIQIQIILRFSLQTILLLMLHLLKCSKLHCAYVYKCIFSH